MLAVLYTTYSEQKTQTGKYQHKTQKETKTFHIFPFYLSDVNHFVLHFGWWEIKLNRDKNYTKTNLIYLESPILMRNTANFKEHYSEDEWCKSRKRKYEI